MSKPSIDSPAAFAAASYVTPEKRREKSGSFEEEKSRGSSGNSRRSDGGAAAFASSGAGGTTVTFPDEAEASTSEFAGEEEELLLSAEELMRSSPPKAFGIEEVLGASETPAVPKTKVIADIFRGNRSGVRPPTFLGKSQGHHVTAYGVINRAIQDLFEKAPDDDKELRDRRNFLFDVVDRVCVIAYESRDVDVLESGIANIKGAVGQYLDQRKNILSIESGIIKRLKHSSSESDFSDIETELQGVIYLTDSSKKLHLVPLITATSGFLLKIFNQTSGATYPTVNNVNPDMGEGTRVAEALRILEDIFPLETRVAKHAALEKTSVDSVAGAASASSGNGSESAAASSRDKTRDELTPDMLHPDSPLLHAVSNLFFYPKVPDDKLFAPRSEEELIRWQRHNRLSSRSFSRDNSPENLYRAVARHCSLISAIYPSLNSQRFFDIFSMRVAGEWGMEGAEIGTMIEGVKESLRSLEKARIDYEKELEPAKVAPTPFRSVRVKTRKTAALAQEDASRRLDIDFDGIPDDMDAIASREDYSEQAAGGGNVGPRTVGDVSGLRAAGLTGEVSAAAMTPAVSDPRDGKERE